MKIKLPKLFVKPKNLLSKHINSFITHAFSTSISRRSSSSSRGGNKSRASTMGEKLFDDQIKSKMICHEPTDTYKSLSFREFLENNKDNDGRKVTIFKKKGARRITGNNNNNNNDVFIAKECSKHSGRICSRTASGRRKSTQNAIIIIDNAGEEEDENENGGVELCKKRILMGVKCRPINVSGCLNYDDTGILLPEEIFE